MKKLHRTVENDHIPPENAQTSQNDQINFTELLKLITYFLRMHRHQINFTKLSRLITYPLKMHRQAKTVRSTSKNCRNWSHTSWGCTDRPEWSGQLHRTTKNDHVLTEDTQPSHNDQVNFTELSRMITYPLRMHRQAKMVRSTSQSYQKWLHTC